MHSSGNVILNACLSVCMCKCVRVSKSVAACLPAFLSPGGGGGGGGGHNLYIFFINLSDYILPPGVYQSVFMYVCISARTCPGLPQTYFLPYLNFDLFRITIFTILNIKLFVKDYTCVILMAREVVLNRTSLSGRDANRVQESGVNLSQNAIISFPCVPNATYLRSITRFQRKK